MSSNVNIATRSKKRILKVSPLNDAVSGAEVVVPATPFQATSTF